MEVRPMPETPDVVLGAGSGALPGVSAAPAGQPAGGVVVLQEAFGLTSHIRSICGRLAGAGYLAVAPALFHRQGAPVLGYDEFARAQPLMGRLRAEEIMSDVTAALDYLRDRGLPAGRCAAVGFCMGGSVAFVMATRFDLGAAVSFYGGGVAAGRFGFPPLAEAAPALRVPWLGLYGDEDATIPVEQVETLRERAALSPAATEVVRYPAAGHGFNCDDRGAYVPAAAADAWSRTLDWLAAHLAGAGGSASPAG
jgi:carboxymethylenebutenolidase